jgi:hypothetical protein
MTLDLLLSTIAHIPISAEARGKRRLWKAIELARFSKVLELFDDRDVRRAAKEFSRRNGRHMAASFILRKFDAVAWPVTRDLQAKPPYLSWRTIWPSEEPPIRATAEHTLSASESEKASSVFYVATDPDVLLMRGLWSLSVDDHAIGRLIDRCPGADISATIVEGHDALLGMADRHIEPITQAGDNLLLPTTQGAFWCRVSVLRATESRRWVIHTRARTWLDHDQLRPEQTADIQKLMTSQSGDRPMGHFVLHPRTMRDLGRLASSA